MNVAGLVLFRVCLGACAYPALQGVFSALDYRIVRNCADSDIEYAFPQVDSGIIFHGIDRNSAVA